MKIARFEFSLFGINTYVVYDPVSKDCAIVDPGMIADDERKAIENFIKNNGLHVTHIINTHLHIDHAIANGWAAAKFDAKVYSHPDDDFLGKRMQDQARSFGLPINLVDSANPTDVKLHDGEVIHIGEGELKVLHVPGHSKGSVALYDAKDGFLISGDALFAGSIGRTDLPGGDFKELIDSIKTKLLPLPDSTVVYPGHGPATTIGKERRSNPYLIV